MVTHKGLVKRRNFIAIVTVLGFAWENPKVLGVQVDFDLPSAIECRDVTPREFATANPELKIVEAQLRISARILDGAASEIVDFVYTLKTEQTMRIHEYLPATTLESAIAADQIEVTAANENTAAIGLEAKGLTVPLTIGASHSQNTKTSESSHYKQVAAKDMVLASGTIDREHGVFYRIRPSRMSSLEGARDFTLRIVVPRTWRGALCGIDCSSRATKQTTFSTSLVSAGICRGQVGMYLARDVEAAAVAEDLCISQERLVELAAKPEKGNIFRVISVDGGKLFGNKEAARRHQQILDIENAVHAAEAQLQRWAK
jgi:hypothetical protein